MSLISFVISLLLMVPLLSTDADRPHLYFGYGSNLSYDFFKERLKNGPWDQDGWHRSGEIEGPIPIMLGTYLLPDYEFNYQLDGRLFGESGTSGNITPKKGASVLGVLYQISDVHLKELDKTEGVDPLNMEKGAYKRVALKVHKIACTELGITPSGESTDTFVYVGNPQHLTEEIDPDPLYIKLLVESAESLNFPTSYVEGYLIPAVPAFSHS